MLFSTRTTISVIGTLLLSIVLSHTAAAEYVAYSKSITGSKQALPENVDAIPAEDMVSVVWGKYSGSKARVAVLEVENNSNAESIVIRGFGGETMEFSKGSKGIPVDGIEAMLIDILHQSGRFRIVERTVIDKTLKEQDFGASGRVAKPSAAKIGKILGAQYQIQAVVTHYEPEYKGKKMGLGGLVGGAAGALLGGVGFKSKKSLVGMNFRLIDSTSSEVIFTKQVESIISQSGLSFGGIGGGGGGILGGFMSSYTKTPIGQAVLAAINKGVFDLVKQVGAAPVTGSVIKVSGSKIYINIGEGGVAKGDTLTVMSVGEELIDPDTGISLGAEEEELGSIKISSVKEKFSIAKAVDLKASEISKGFKVISTAVVPDMEFAENWTKKK